MLESMSMSAALRVVRIEPDFVQTGDLSLTIKGRANARAPVETLTSHTFNDDPKTPDEQTIKLLNNQRLMSFRFESNVQGGDYQYGDTYAHIGPGDKRVET